MKITKSINVLKHVEKNHRTERVTEKSQSLRRHLGAVVGKCQKWRRGKTKLDVLFSDLFCFVFHNFELLNMRAKQRDLVFS